MTYAAGLRNTVGAGRLRVSTSQHAHANIDATLAPTAAGAGIGASPAATFSVSSTLVAATAAGLGSSPSGALVGPATLAAQAGAAVGASPSATFSVSKVFVAETAAGVGASAAATFTSTAVLAAVAATALGASPTATLVVPGGWQFSSPSSSGMGTATTDALGPDGFTWAQGSNPIADKYGNLVAFCCTSDKLIPVVRQASDGAWEDPTLSGFQNGNTGETGSRVALAYDPVHDTVHGIFLRTVDPTDVSIYYRRFTLTYTSQDVTTVTKDSAINLSMDKQRTVAGGDGYDDISSGAQHPCALWFDDGSTYGRLIAAWGFNWDTGSAVGGKVVASYRILTNDADDGDATNWRSLVGGSSIPDPSAVPTQHVPLVPHNQINTATADPGFYGAYNLYPAMAQDPDNTLVFLWSDVSGSGHVGGLYARKAPWSTSVWGLAGGAGNQKSGPLLVATGTDAGYTLKHEPITGLHYDATNARMWFGYTAWVDDTQGDGWCVDYLTTTGASGVLAFYSGATPRVVAYAAGAGPSEAAQFVVGDVAWDDTDGALLVSFTNLLNHDVLATLYDASGTVLAGPSTRYTALPYDIPVIAWTTDAGYVAVGRTFNIEMRDSPPVASGGPYSGVEVSLDFSAPGVDATLAAVAAAGTGASPASTLKAASALVGVAAAGAGTSPTATIAGAAAFAGAVAAGLGTSPSATVIAASALVAAQAAGVGASAAASIQGSATSTLLAQPAAGVGAGQAAAYHAGVLFAASVAAGTGASPAASYAVAAIVAAAVAAGIGSSPTATYHAPALMAAAVAAVVASSPAASMRSADIWLASVALALAVPSVALVLDAPTLDLALEVS